MYAREDTHYLLYIYDRMRNELIRRSNTQSNLINLVLTNSRHISLKLYIKPVMSEDSYLKLCKKFRRRNLSQPQVIIINKLMYSLSLSLFSCMLLRSCMNGVII